MPTLAAIDLETDGLIEETIPEIIEIGIKKSFPTGYDKGVSKGASWLVLPVKYINQELPPIITEITGITTDQLRSEGLPIGKALLELAFALVGVDHLITYNGETFDLPILRHHLGPDISRFPWPPIQLDMIDIAKPIVKSQGKTGRKYPRLEETVQFCFPGREWKAHRALDDAEATLECAIHFEKEGHIQFVER